MRRAAFAVCFGFVAACVAPAFSQTSGAPPPVGMPAPTPIPLRPVGGISGPTVTSSYPTPLPALKGVQLKPVSIMVMPDFSSRNRLTRAQRKARRLLEGQIGEQPMIVGTPQEIYDLTTRLYRQRTLESRRYAADRGLQQVHLRVAR
jgi:hypothetical protein